MILSKLMVLGSIGVIVGKLQGGSLEIVAHRGASADAPENTLAAFKAAFEQQADAIECDIHLTRDGRLVVLHDASTARTSGVTNKVSECTWRQLRRLNVGAWGKWKDKGFAEKIPLLEEVLRLVPDGKRIFIEIKCGPEALPELSRVLSKAGKKTHQIVLIGFGFETVKQVKQSLAQYEICWLAAPDKKDKSKPKLDNLVAQARAAKLDGLDLEASFPLDGAFVERVHGAGLKLYTWTVDDTNVARQLAEIGVDGITTNRPRWIRGELAKTDK